MADERRIIELVVKATGDEEMKKMTRELLAVRTAAEKSQTSLDKMSGSVKSLGGFIKGEFIGRQIAQAFTALTNAAVDATKQMDEFAVAIGKGDISKLDDDAKALAKTLSGEALAGAHALTTEVHDMQQAIAKASMEIMGGLAPALTTLIQQLKAAVGSGGDFVSIGRSIGDVVVSITAEFAAGAAEIKAYGESFAHLGKAIADVSAAKNFASIGEFSLAKKAAGEAIAEAGKVGAAIAGVNSKRAAAAKEVTDAYAANIAAAKKAGAELDKIRDKGLIETAPGKAGKGGKAKSTKEETADTLDLAKATQTLWEQVAKLTEAREKAAKAQADYVATLERAADPTIAYAEGMQKLAETQQAVHLSAEAVRVETERLTEVRDNATKALVENSAAHKQLVADQEAAAKKLEEFKQQWGFIGDAVQQATFDVITGAAKIGLAVKRMVAQILSEIAKMLATKLATQLVTSLLGPSAGAGGFNYGAMTPHAKGAAFAAGGIVTAPTRFAYGGGIGIMGEAGPEAVMPLKRNSSGQLGVISAGGGVNVVVNNNAPSAAIGVRSTGDGVQIDVIERQLADRIRRGGSALPGAIENTYRAGRGSAASFG